MKIIVVLGKFDGISSTLCENKVNCVLFTDILNCQGDIKQP